MMRRRSAASRWLRAWEVIPTAVAAALISVQLFVPPIIGMADNGDFAKVAGRLCMRPPPDTLEHPVRYRHFFLSAYDVRPEHCRVYWPWSPMVSIAWLAKQAQAATGAGTRFDMRALGALCTAWWLACIWGMFRLLRGAPVAVRIAAAAAIPVLTDVVYVAYFHSLYADATAMMLVFSTGLLAWRAAQTGAPAWILGFTGSAVLLVLSKAPHVVFVPWLGLFAVFSWWRSRSPAWAATGLGLVLAATCALAFLPAGYSAGTTFNVIFLRLLPGAKDAGALLAEFDLPAEAIRYAGEHVYTATSPFNDSRWRSEHAESLAPGRLAAFYARHPGWMLRNLWQDLSQAAPRMRVGGNYRREDGHPGDRAAPSLLGWSDLRARLLREYPAHVPLFYLGVLLGGALLALRGREAWQQIGGAWCFTLAGAAVTEYGVSCLFDAVATRRHLFVFHVLTEALVVHAALAIAYLGSRGRGAAAPPRASPAP